MTADRAQPHDVAAEEAVIGAMLVNPGALEPAFDILESGDFYRFAYQQVFDACGALYARNEPVDSTTVAATLATAKVKIDAAELLTLAASGQYRSTNVRKYARIVKYNSLRRAVIAAGVDIAGLGWEPGARSEEELVDQAESLVHIVGDHRRVERRLAAIGAAVDGWYDTVQARSVHDTGVAGVATGWDTLDGYLAGLRPGQLVTVAARPSMGKSMWAGQLAINVATAGHPVLFVSAEMSLSELMDRFMAQLAGVALDGIRKGQVFPKDWERLSGVIGRVKNLPLYVADEATSTLFTIRSAARRVTAAADRLGLVIVDYLQLLTPVWRHENRQVEVAELSRGLKKLAMDMAVPVVSLAQLNRNLEQRSAADRRPRLSDLRESGAIEADSDVVMFLYRDEVYNPKTDRGGICDVVIAKQRNGPIGEVGLGFDVRTGRFAPMGAGRF